MRVKHLVIRSCLITLVVLVAPFWPRLAQACTCGPQTVEQARSTADVVFAGAVEDVTVVDDQKAYEPRIIVQFRVAKVWKGRVDSTFVMHSNVEFSSCGGFFRELLQKDKTVLVYGFGRPAKQWKGNRVDGASNARSLTVMPRGAKAVRQELVDAVPDAQIVYTTNICSRTRPVEYAVEDFEKLGSAQDLGPLQALPDPELVEATRYISNDLPGCADLDNAREWKVLSSPPEDAEKLRSIFALSSRGSVPDVIPLEFNEHWLSGAEGRLGYCRVGKNPEYVCGNGYAQFMPDPDRQGAWKAGDSGVSTYCETVPGLGKASRSRKR